MVTSSAHVMLPPSSLTPSIPPSIVLVAASPSLSSRPHVSLDQLYTSSDADSLWGAHYRLKQKTSTEFVLAFDKKLIQSVGV